MNPASSTEGREPQEEAPRRTPSTDLQAEDTGTTDSGGQEPAGGRGTAAESAMKQTDKTEQETGSRR